MESCLVWVPLARAFDSRSANVVGFVRIPVSRFQSARWRLHSPTRGRQVRAHLGLRVRLGAAGGGALRDSVGGRGGVALVDDLLGGASRGDCFGVVFGG